MTLLPFLLLIVAVIVGYAINRMAARAIRDGGSRLHSMTSYHGMFSALLILVPVLTFMLLWLALQGDQICVARANLWHTRRLEDRGC